MKRNGIIGVLTGFLVLCAGVGAGWIWGVEEEPSSSAISNIAARRASGFGEQKEGSAQMSSAVFSEKELVRFIKRVNEFSTSEELKKELDSLLLMAKDKQSAEQCQIALEILFTRWGEIAPKEGLKVLAGIEGCSNVDFEFLIGRCAENVFSAWAEKDMDEAVAFYTDHGIYDTRTSDTRGKLISAWCRKSPEDAWKWLASLPPSQQGGTMVSFFETLLDKHPGRMNEFVEKIILPTGGDGVAAVPLNQSYMLEEFLVKWAQKEEAAAAAWMKKLPFQTQENIMLKILVREKGAPPDEIAKVWQVAPEEKRSQLARHVLEMAEYSWETGLQNRLVERVAAQFPDLDLGYTSVGRNMNRAQLEQLPEGKLRDKLISSFITSNRGESWEEKWELSKKIKDPKKRVQDQKWIRARSAVTEITGAPVFSP